MSASKVIKIDDFDKGRMRIPRNTWDDDDVQDYIDDQEEEHLIRLLGFDLSVLFLADLDGNGVPQTQRFTDIYDSFVIDKNSFGCIGIDNDGCGRCRSRGMKKMLKGLIFFHIQRDQTVQPTTTGPKRKKGENSENMDMSSFDITTRYNNSVSDYQCIQRKICDNIGTYPEFKGVHLEYVLFV